MPAKSPPAGLRWDRRLWFFRPLDERALRDFEGLLERELKPVYLG